MKSAILPTLALVFGISNAATAIEVFPTVTTNDLNGRELTIPSELAAHPAVILIAFKQRQQAQIDEWIAGLNLTATDAPEWIEMPIVPNYGRLWRGFVDNGMRSGITSVATRARVFTVYGPVSRIREQMEIPTEDKVVVMVVGKDGRILARADGDYSVDAAKGIVAALN